MGTGFGIGALTIDLAFLKQVISCAHGAGIGKENFVRDFITSRV